MKMQFNFDIMSRYASDGQGPVAGAGFDQFGLVYGFGTRFAADF